MDRYPARHRRCSTVLYMHPIYSRQASITVICDMKFSDPPESNWLGQQPSQVMWYNIFPVDTSILWYFDTCGDDDDDDEKR